MLRLLTVAVLALLLTAGGVRAAEIKGKIKSVDPEKGTITLTVDDRDQEFTVPAAVKITIFEAVAAREAKDGLKDPLFKMAKGMLAAVATEQKDGKEVVIRMVVNTNRID
jgi:hypothetical protein